MASLKDTEILQTSRFAPAITAELKDRFTVHDATASTDKDAVIAGVKDRVRGIATSGHVRADAAFIDSLPKLEIIASFSAGLDAIDVGHARKKGIAVTNSSQALAEDVADVAFSLTLNVVRRFVAAERYVRDGKWLKGEFPLATRIAGKTMGILGLGTIGRAIARRAEAAGMTIAYSTRRPRSDVAYRHFPRVRDLAEAAEVLVVACPGGAETRHLVNAEVLTALGPKGYLVNIARGSIVDEAALIAALEKGAIAGAGLDVFADEPRVPEALIRRDDVVVYPHIGSATEETRYAMGRAVIDNLVAHFEGRGVLTPAA
jgi:lactate dehydrogenase-like 2-hydroxyacid dehydrogenase